MDYQAFLQAKVRLREETGFEVDPAEINPELKDSSRAIVQWALRRGRAGVFANFGLHKTAIQIEAMRLIGKYHPCPRLITIPIGVRSVFIEEAKLRFRGTYAVNLRFIQDDREVDDENTIYLTNYESVREGKVTPKVFRAAGSLDEADMLRSFGSKTFGEFCFGDWRQLLYKLVCTATPDPNEHLELISYAHFLGIMDMGESKTRFFKRDSEHADKLTLHPHKEDEFWLWVHSWALFVQKPSDLGFSDEGYVFPPLDVRWHEVPTDHSSAIPSKLGQGKLLKDAAIGVQDSAKEKRESLPTRIAKVMELRAEEPGAHRIIWHDLEAERHALEKAIPSLATVFGNQDLYEREQKVLGFSDGSIQELAAKPVMLGGGNNFQYHCHWAIFAGIGHKFRDFIQALHRLQRFGQDFPVRVDLIYTEAERRTRENLEAKWKRHERKMEIMAGIIRKYGLSQSGIEQALSRSIGVAREESSGPNWRMVNNDSVIECRGLEENSVDAIVSSLPFSTQYEYTPSYNDFGHTDDDPHFFTQMDFLTPELFRALKPGRVAAIHVKDRVVPGAITGHGYQTISPFHARCIDHFMRHGFTYGGMITVVTDVVRENNQTYRLGWSEQCKDGSRMGVGLPEYVLLFRKPPTSSENGYANEPVVKSKEQYTRGRWQNDAHALWRSSGDRLLCPEDLVGLSYKQIFWAFRAHSQSTVYDHEQDVAIAEGLDSAGSLPPDFMLLQPQSHHDEVWTDVMRARTLNSSQVHGGRDKHICPLQFDIVDRLIRRFSNEGEVVLDPFAGIGTVPLRALKMHRFGVGIELNHQYWKDACHYLRRQELDQDIPTLFDFEEDPMEAVA